MVATIETQANMLLALGKQPNDPDVGLIGYLQTIVDQMICDELGWQVVQQQFTEWYPDRNLSNIRDELVDTAPYEMVGGRAVQYGLLGLNAQTIQLRQLPVRQIVQCFENPGAWDVPNPPSFPLSSLLTEGNDFFVDWEAPDLTGTKISWTGEVYRLTGAWYVSPWSGRSVQVTYTAGFTAAELASGPWPAFFPRVRLASVHSVFKFYKELKAQMDDQVTGASGGAYTSESIDGYSISYQAQAALDNLGFQLTLPKSAMRILEPYRRMTQYLGP